MALSKIQTGMRDNITNSELPDIQASDLNVTAQGVGLSGFEHIETRVCKSNGDSNFGGNQQIRINLSSVKHLYSSYKIIYHLGWTGTTNTTNLLFDTLRGDGATITEFSTDGTFTADSDNIVPTQKAIKTYITSQIGGGQGELNVNSITAGVVQISGSTITTTTNVAINTLQKVNFTKGVDGHPLAMNYYLQQ